ncbi:MAG: YitT family protein [Candidatus Caccosoma sp.]|nr:YitT family protein [Candidatus Caccosoma sp.]
MKKNIKISERIVNIILILFGSALVALSNSIFIVPFNIVKGGMTSVAMMISNLLYPLTNSNTTDIVLWIVNMALWLVALFLIGKKFAMSTLVGTVGYSVFMSLFLRLDLVNKFKLMEYYGSGDATAKLILFGLAGGVIAGFGASLCFMGKGSTGGSDVISVACVKYLNVKQDVATLTIDVITIVLGFIIFKSWESLLVGILSALITSVAIKNIYGKYNTIYIIDILTEKVDEIQRIISEEFHDTSTIYIVEGGYSKEPKKVVHCVLVYKEAKMLKAMIPEIDKNAFVTEYETTSAYGGSTYDAYLSNKTKEKILNKINH